jgi:ATP-binding cassette, subfamily B, bacterial
MAQEEKEQKKSGSTRKGLFSLLKPYRKMILLLILLTLIGNGVNLVIPRIIAQAIDSFIQGHFIMKTIAIEFLIAVGIIFIFTYMQSIVQTYASEKVAFDLRSGLSDKISQRSYFYIQNANPSRLLTNLTSDIDSVKMFVSMAVATIASSLIIIIGTAILLLSINVKLAVPVLIIIPLIALTFALILRKVSVLFMKSREVIDWLNKIINESIIGAAIIRVINSQHYEYRKFLEANTEAKNLGISILTLFATLIPLITFFSNLATLVILALGGHFVMTGKLSLGDFAAFNSYLAMLIFPIIIIGFMSNVIAQASASYERVNNVMKADEPVNTGTLAGKIQGNIQMKDINVVYDGKPALKNLSLKIKGGSRAAIIGPTAAGKSQLLYLLTGLVRPTSGQIELDGNLLVDYEKNSFHNQVGFVFQDSVLFNMSLRENIAFNEKVTDESLEKAIETAELKDFIDTLPDKLDTIISERGTSLSGGQKQRIMLARALALNPGILLLDDFTARVDQQTELKILDNVNKNYPELTLISVTQKISSVTDYDDIILLMEGELIASGNFNDLMNNCPEFVQIYNSQRSMTHYEL